MKTDEHGSLKTAGNLWRQS